MKPAKVAKSGIKIAVTAAVGNYYSKILPSVLTPGVFPPFWDRMICCGIIILPLTMVLYILHEIRHETTK